MFHTRRTLSAASAALALALAACADDAGPTAPGRAGAAPRAALVGATAAAANGRLAFASRRDGNPEIYAMAADGSGAVRLTNDPADDLEPAWSPDGSRIAFTSARAGAYNVWVMNADGTEPRQLTTDAAGDYDPAWSPDGRLIAFVSERAGSADVHVMNADGSDQRRLTEFGTIEVEPAWSPDGSRIVFTASNESYSDLYVMNADGSGETNLTKTDDAQEQHPSWSPDGSRIAFQSSAAGWFNIWAMNADGSARTQLTDANSTDVEPAWSPDGARIAFTSQRDGYSELYMMNADGSAETRLTSQEGEESGAAWETIALATRPQAITFTSAPPELALRGTSYQVSAAGGGSGNPVLLASLTPTVCTVPAGAASTAAVSLVAVGTCTLTADQAGGGGYDPAPQATQSFAVLYTFSDFAAPIDNAPAVNTVKAGRGIPVKFTLGGDQGLAIFRPGYPRFVSEPCAPGIAADAIDLVTDSPSGLSYDAATGQYTYVWKTSSALAGRCGRLELGLVDMSDRYALFHFTR